MHEPMFSFAMTQTPVTYTQTPTQQSKLLKFHASRLTLSTFLIVSSIELKILRPSNRFSLSVLLSTHLHRFLQAPIRFRD